MFKHHPLPSSRLYDQDTFWRSFIKDVSCAQKQVIIESPFITTKRSSELLPIFIKLRKRGVQIIVNTRNPLDHDAIYQAQAEEAIFQWQELGIIVLYTVGHHRKLAIIDTETIWEGSLNILSFNDSCEIMRRITSSEQAALLMNFIKLDRYRGAIL